MAARAYDENTGARGLVSAVEKLLLHFENRLPSTRIRRFPVNHEGPGQARKHIWSPVRQSRRTPRFTLEAYEALTAG